MIVETEPSKVKRIGIIYKITSPSNDKVYIGSTKNRLCLRKALHRHHYKRYLNNKNAYCSSFELLKDPNCTYETIEAFPFTKMEQLRRREQEIQNQYAEQGLLINMNASHVTIEERKEKQRLRAKERYYNDVVVEREKRLASYYAKREQKLKVAKEWYQKHKEEMRERVKQNRCNRQTCECGITYTCTTEKHKSGLPHKRKIALKNNHNNADPN